MPDAFDQTVTQRELNNFHSLFHLKPLNWNIYMEFKDRLHLSKFGMNVTILVSRTISNFIHHQCRLTNDDYNIMNIMMLQFCSIWQLDNIT